MKLWHSVIVQMQHTQEQQRRRAARLARLSNPGSAAWLWRLLARAWLRAGYFVSDHMRTPLILAVFTLKVWQTY